MTGTAMATEPVYGLIEWDGSYRPTVIVGCCFDAVVRDIIAIFTAVVATGGAVGSPEFQQQHPLPDPHASGEIIADWLDALREDTTVPYVTLLDATDLVHTGHNLLVVDRYAANPYVSRRIERQPAAVAHEPGRVPTVVSAPPTVVNGYPVVAAVAEREDAGSWIVICRRTERMPDWAADTAWYVTWRAWHAGGRWHAERGDYGPHHGLTWAQAQQSLLRRLDLPTPSQRPAVDPDVYLRADDDGDWLTCPSCHEPITMLTGGDRLGSLLAEVTSHRCDPATTP
ncbi:hypothetical protein [Asanoa iriomotensis]|uniref:Nucleic acid/nucleotide deaminase of polymorphic system toxin n=1 Tax=Asanoa iriomotensis TaxID=234613 RepID=A0ABQ4CG20_9ACTN|nr:hypothetical protein [Asanoa iriomotensis]GIF61700.1 hypothetical protein Air01nite_77950 [Asanoa iriomotensis]